MLVSDMEITRLGVSVYPTPVLSVEFVRNSELLVWRVELYDVANASIDETVIQLQRRFPEYLGPVSSVQLARLVRFSMRLNSGRKSSDTENMTTRVNHRKSGDLNKLDDAELKQRKDEMEHMYERNRISKCDANFVYDYQVDFATPTGQVINYSDDDENV